MIGAAAKFREYGLTNATPGAMDDCAFLDARDGAGAHRESAGHPLTIASAGWSPGTNECCADRSCTLTRKRKGISRSSRKAEGRDRHLPGAGESLSAQAGEFEWRLIRPMQQPPPVKGQPPAPSPFATLQEAARARNEFFNQEGVAAVLARFEQATRPVQHDRHRRGEVRYRRDPDGVRHR